MKIGLLIMVGLAAGVMSGAAADVPRTPPMGWNSYDETRSGRAEAMNFVCG